MMDISNLRNDWSYFSPILQRTFRHSQIPDISPHGPLWENLLDRLARSHDLTRAEVEEIIEDTSMCHHTVLQDSRAA